MEGPFAEFTGYVAGDKSRKPTIRVTAITHRNNPILRGAIEGSLPGSFSENGICSSIMRASTAWNVLDRAGVPGITDVWCPPVQTGINLLIRMKSSTAIGQAGPTTGAVSPLRTHGTSRGHDDIDIHGYCGGWAIAHANAGETTSSYRRRSAPAQILTVAIATRRCSAPANGISVLIDAMNLVTTPIPSSAARFSQGLAGAQRCRRDGGALDRVRPDSRKSLRPARSAVPAVVPGGAP
jgi:hypothetical protein